MTRTDRESLLWERMTEYLEDHSVDDLLEEFDIQPEEAIITLFDGGLIEQEKLYDLIGIDIE